MNNIAEYIAYLIGDSERTTIPKYEGILSQSGNVILRTGIKQQIVYNMDTLPLSEIPHPIGFLSIKEIGLLDANGNILVPSELESTSAVFGSSLHFVGDLISMQYGYSYEILWGPFDDYNDDGTIDVLDFVSLLDIENGPSIETTAYGVQISFNENISYPNNQIPYRIINKFINESIKSVSGLLPDELKVHMISTKNFEAGAYSDLGGGINLDILGTDKIIGVVRFDGDTAYECRQIPNHLRSKARFGSGFLEECSETDPIFYLKNDKASVQTIVVEPAPDESDEYADDGFCQIDFISHPVLTAMMDNADGIPQDVQNTIYLSAAIKCKEFQLNRVFAPIVSQYRLADGFIPPSLSGLDALNNAQELIDEKITGINGYLSDEDIALTESTLAISKQELEIASVQLAEKDKEASAFLSEYSQNISMFAQAIQRAQFVWKKTEAQLDRLKEQYQESLYALRGELPNKQQLGASDKKIQQIKSVVSS